MIRSCLLRPGYNYVEQRAVRSLLLCMRSSAYHKDIKAGMRKHNRLVCFVSFVSNGGWNLSGSHTTQPLRWQQCWKRSVISWFCALYSAWLPSPCFYSTTKAAVSPIYRGLILWKMPPVRFPGLLRTTWTGYWTRRVETWLLVKRQGTKPETPPSYPARTTLRISLDLSRWSLVTPGRGMKSEGKSVLLSRTAEDTNQPTVSLNTR